MKKFWIVVEVIFAMVIVAAVLFGGYEWGRYQGDKVCKKLFAESQKKVVKKIVVKEMVVEKMVVKKKPSKKVAKPFKKQPLVLVPAPAPVLPLVPPAPVQQKLVLRINVVEWSPVFKQLQSLMSRNIGSIIRKGLADGTVKRTTRSLAFNVNGATVTVQGGQKVLDPGQIGLETILVVQPLDVALFVSPPNGVPLVTEPGELVSLVKRGVKEIWLNFVLSERST